jgi:hypothetical protein
LLVEFASAVDAVNCAIDMRRKVVVDLAPLGDPTVCSLRRRVRPGPTIGDLTAAERCLSRRLMSAVCHPHRVVLGGGYVGPELVHAHRRFGSRVTVIEGH